MSPKTIMPLLRALAPLLLAALAGAAAAQPPTAVELDNGLTVLVKEERRAGVAIASLWYHVGSGYEHRPLTGVSHALEHMMFQGTEEREGGAFSRLIAREGGWHNAFTSRDYTGYYEKLAAGRLELAFRLEAERMHRLALEQPAFEREMRVIREERRQRVADTPEARAFERFTAVSHMASPYRQPIIGWRQDLQRLRLEDLQRWYERWYAPANATLIVVGDVDTERIRELAERHFGEVPAGEPPPAPPGGEAAGPLGQRRGELQLDGARVPLLYVGYNVPSLGTAERPRDAYALLMAAQLLDGGRSARLAAELVRGAEVATSASAYYSQASRLDTLFTLVARPRAEAAGTGLDRLQAALGEQIERLRTEPVGEAELERAVTRLLARETYARDSLMGQARRLGELVTAGIGWQEAQRLEERIRAVTAADIQRVARRYLRPERRTVGRLLPGEGS